jgi:hypothetical protein
MIQLKSVIEVTFLIHLLLLQRTDLHHETSYLYLKLRQINVVW